MKIIVAIVAGIVALISGSYVISELHQTEDDIGEQGYSDYGLPNTSPSTINKVAVTINIVLMIAGIFTVIIVFQSCFHL